MIEAATTLPPPLAPKSTAPSADHAMQAKSVLSGAFAFLLGVVDVINPLQHIPVVSTLYRAATGDAIAPQAKLAGAALFGGPIGFAAAMANLAVRETTGRDVGEHLMAATLGSDDPFGRRRAGDAQFAEAADGKAIAASDIVWNGPRRYAASATPSVPQTAAAGERITWSGPRQWPAPVGWVTMALTQAEAIAAGVGTDAAKPATAPWVSSAMMEALDKYRALAKQRHGDDRPS